VRGIRTIWRKSLALDSEFIHAVTHSTGIPFQAGGDRDAALDALTAFFENTGNGVVHHVVDSPRLGKAALPKPGLTIRSYSTTTCFSADIVNDGEH
jgi:hypothetical protein